MELENADSNALIWKAVYIGTIPCCDHDQLHTWHGWVISLAFNTAVDGTACVQSTACFQPDYYNITKLKCVY